ncbi:GAF domain-containing protein [Deltaproteobacteria bacterium]|nr:GAF domain-containing protein [Deltaproteobacteria bacterium]
MKSTPPLNNVHEPLYNSRLIKNYVVYMKKYYPEVEIDSVLSYAYINSYELKDNGHWFSQWQVDRFHERLSRETKNPNISREVGRYMASTDASDPLKNYITGFMTPAAAYWVLEKISPHLSRASTLKTKKLGPNKIEVSATPNPGVTEKLYQCDNRCGIFEALAKVFTNKYAVIDHTTCVHRGGEVCRYIITWENTHSFLLRRARFFFLPLALLSFAALYLFTPPIWFAGVLFLCASFMVGIAIFAEQVGKKELVQNIKDQRNAAKLLLNEINRRYNDALLIKEIGQATSKLLNIDDLLLSVTESMEKLLDYDRGGIWLADSKNTRLVYRVGYGYEPDIEILLRGADFHLNNPNSRGVAVQAFRKNRPFLVNNISEIERDLSARSLEFLKKTGAHSFICVPLVYERRSFGILFVDNLKSKRDLSQSDISLLTGISRQIAISINNAMSYQKLEESKERERNIRKLFESYVPPSVIKRYVSGVDLFRGEEASISALFLDIRGFTSSTEMMRVGDVVLFLNQYFEKCSHIISEEHGHINKYTGDGFLAIFGAPEPLENHVAMSFNAACRILELSGRLVMGDSPIEIGIGIHTGRAILGNLGSRTKMEYTAIGDTVNTAARLQELTKQFEEFSLIISRDVLDEVDIGHPCYKSMINLGIQEIRGKKDSLEMFGLKALTRGNPFSTHEDLTDGLEPIQVTSGV